MTVLDLSANCDIIKTSFLEDLYSYSIKDGSINWSDNNGSTTFTVKNNIFSAITPKDIWTPNFVTSDLNIDNKIISNYGSIKGDTSFDSGRIGCEDFISFSPKFKNWTVGSAQMTIDWILNRSKTPYSIVAGIDYWKISKTEVRGTIEKFPIYSKIKHNNITYTKLDNNILRKFAPSQAKQGVFDSNGNLSFSYTADDQNIYVTGLYTNNTPPEFTLDGSDATEVWLPDGDQILYFINGSEKEKNLVTDSIGPRSYVSSPLYKYYNTIYNSITANEPYAGLKDTRSVKKLRLYKKLAHSISTSPFVSEFIVSLLSKPSAAIKEAINTYLNSNSPNMETDILNLNTVLIAISTEYSKYEILSADNIIHNNDELFIKLINKYGAKLKLVGSSTISYSKLLKHGDSILIEEIGDTLVSKGLRNTTVINNKKISLNKLSIETNLSENDSSISLKTDGDITNKVYLYDSVKPDILSDSYLAIVLENNTYRTDDGVGGPITKIPKIKDYDPDNSVFYWGPYTQDPSRPKDPADPAVGPVLKVLHLNLNKKFEDSRFPQQAINLVNNEFICLWEKVSGPTLKFLDFNKKQTNRSYDRAYGTETQMMPSSTGKYVIKCTVTCPYGTYTVLRTIFIVDGAEKKQPGPRPGGAPPPPIDNPDFKKYSDGTLNILLTDIELDKYISEKKKLLINRDNLKVFISNLNSIAIHRNGLYSPIKTNNLVERISSRTRTIEKLDTDYHFLFKKTEPITNPAIKDSSLVIEYYCNNTIIKLDRILLKNIRNQTEECSQCYSLYYPKFKSFIGGIGEGRPFFVRSNKNLDGFNLEKYIYENNEFKRAVSPESYDYPIISTDIAPPIKGCGGYGNKILNSIAKNTGILRKFLGFTPDLTNENTGIIASTPKVLPSVTGYRLDYKDDFTTLDDKIRNYKICYQENIMPSGSGITFTKGSFYPNSGWIVENTGNLSSVLKFNPGARKSYTFVGPGLLELRNYTTTTGITPHVFNSTIELNINKDITWNLGTDQYCPEDLKIPGAAERNRNNRADINALYNIGNPVLKELTDQYIGGTNQYNHGYRVLGGGLPKLSELNASSIVSPQNDEFNTSAFENENKFIYSFNVIGPSNPINISKEDQDAINSYIAKGIKPASDGDGKAIRDYIESNGAPIGLRNPRINNLKIKDIEVQLNFLNYVNTKNLMIWLEIEYGSYEKGEIQLKEVGGDEIGVGSASGPRFKIPKQIKAENIFVDQFISKDTYKSLPSGVISANPPKEYLISDNIPINHSGIKNYIKNLTDMNSGDNPGDNLILYLLNQETIQNKDYNFSIKFTDTASKHNVLFDNNMFSSGSIDANQHIINNNASITPTKNIGSGIYNTYTNATYSNLIKFNNLLINNNTFNKFRDIELFRSAEKIPREGCSYLHPDINSSTKFILHIAILEEEDEMRPLDNLINTELHTDIFPVENKLTCSNIFNHLCSWELILHTEDAKKPIVRQVSPLSNYGGTDALSLIEYGSDPKYPGYSFIANLSDEKFLLPLVNINAPSVFFQDYNICEYPIEDIFDKGKKFTTPRFPTEAVASILGSLASIGAAGGGTLVGTLAAGLGVGYDSGFQQLIEYLRDLRKVPILESVQRDIFDMAYDSYPFGNSDKILINISKDNIFWYKMEASIFKLSNTPSMPLKHYSLIKNNSKLFRFAFSVVLNKNNIIDDLFIPYIRNKAIPRGTVLSAEDDRLYSDLNSIKYTDFNFIDVDELVSYNKFIHSVDIFSHMNNDKESILIDHTIPYSLIKIGDIISFDTSTQTPPLSLTEPVLTNGSVTIPSKIKVLSKALVYKNGRYQTVLGLDLPLSGLVPTNPGSGVYSEIYLPDDVVVICGSNESSQYAKQISPISEYGLVSDQPPNDTISDFTFSLNSLGSYGDGSPYKNKNILSRKVKINNIEPIYNILNNHVNDKYYFNELTVTLPSGAAYAAMAPTSVESGVGIKINTSFTAYPVYYDNSINSVIDNNFYHIPISGDPADTSQYVLSKILNMLPSGDAVYYGDKLKDNRTYSPTNKYNMIYMKIDPPNGFTNLSVINKLYRNTNADITIEDNYTYIPTIENIEQSKVGLLLNRLSTLNKTNDNNLEALILANGITNSTMIDSAILNSDSIYYIQKYYDNIVDPSGCSGNTCYRTKAYNKLQKLYHEKNDILQLINSKMDTHAAIYTTKDNLNNNTIAASGKIVYDNYTNISLSLADSTIKLFNKYDIYGSGGDIRYNYAPNPIKQIYHTGVTGVIPDQKSIISVNLDNSISITYENISNNYYWINIDPKQSCSIAEEMRPKVLKSIEYKCENTNPLFNSLTEIQSFDFNNICPDPSKFDGKKFKEDNTSIDNAIKNNNNIFSIRSDKAGSIYTINEKLIDKRKKDWENKKANVIYGWKEQTIVRKFRVNDEGQASDTTKQNVEFLITAIEKYDVAITKIESIASQNINSINTIKKLIDDGTIKNDFSNDVYGGLLDGTGENSRKQLTRVYNILNLDDIKTIQVQFRKAPRLIRGIDAIGEVLRYGEKNSYKPLADPPIAPLDIFGVGRLESLINNFYQWKCIQKNPSTEDLEYATTPEFFSLLNEMVFRTFFGSIDGIENKSDQLRSSYDFELIPYEYFTK